MIQPVQTPVVKDWLSLLALIAFWGTSFMFIKLSLASFSPLGVVAVRVMLAALLLTAVMFIRGLRFPKLGWSWGYFLLFAFFGNVLPFYLISWGQQNVSSGIAGLLMAIMPLATMVMAHYLLVGESLNRFKVAGFLLGISGVAVILWPTVSAKDSALLSSLLILLAALSYAFNSILVRRLPRHDVLIAGAGLMIAASALVVPIWLTQDVPWQQDYDWNAVASVIWLGIGPTGLATLLYFSVIASAGPTFLSYVNYFIPVVAYFAGALLLGEVVEWHSMSALLLIVAGIALSRRRVDH